VVYSFQVTAWQITGFLCFIGRLSSSRNEMLKGMMIIDNREWTKANISLFLTSCVFYRSHWIAMCKSREAQGQCEAQMVATSFWPMAGGVPAFFVSLSLSRG
jgi:hypothetical protein